LKYFNLSISDVKSRDSSVGITMGYRLEGKRKIFSLLHSVQIGAGAYSANGYSGALSAGVKRPGREADH
jgi:hypothetical protein